MQCVLCPVTLPSIHTLISIYIDSTQCIPVTGMYWPNTFAQSKLKICNVYFVQWLCPQYIHWSQYISIATNASQLLGCTDQIHLELFSMCINQWHLSQYITHSPSSCTTQSQLKMSIMWFIQWHWSQNIVYSLGCTPVTGIHHAVMVKDMQYVFHPMALMGGSSYQQIIDIT